VAPPPGGLDPGWAEAVAGVLDDPSRHRLALQPVADLQRGTVAGYEALSRFAGPPDAGPDVWFEAAGRLGLGAELDARVLLLRPDLVKLDRALVAGCDRDPVKAALIEMLGRPAEPWAALPDGSGGRAGA
jgi:EAL domain-containing protein (putative c-di-GMP-specific phosphodiesterase class I)